ncbi:hypothetical protein NQ317_010225 [Molorchus minor]|uniref:Uncharacterized protein n=1 Tax=Molorchus minor TaxID=1323400 RepID=A0ABQ9J4L5_9CUCU|nr:hypothetical protein NQ317_010225 [Molorchus minor]
MDRGLLLFESKNTGDYHEDMNADVFGSILRKCWIILRATVATSVVRSIYRRGDVGKLSSNPNWVFRFSLLKSDSSGMRYATALLSSPVCYEVGLFCNATLKSLNLHTND